MSRIAIKVSGIDFSDGFSLDGYDIQRQNVHSSNSGLNEKGDELIEVIWRNRHSVSCEWRCVDDVYADKILTALEKTDEMTVEFMDIGKKLTSMTAYLGDVDTKCVGGSIDEPLWNITTTLIESKNKG